MSQARKPSGASAKSSQNTGANESNRICRREEQLQSLSKLIHSPLKSKIVPLPVGSISLPHDNYNTDKNPSGRCQDCSKKYTIPTNAGSSSSAAESSIESMTAKLHAIFADLEAILKQHGTTLQQIELLQLHSPSSTVDDNPPLTPPPDSSEKSYSYPESGSDPKGNSTRPDTDLKIDTSTNTSPGVHPLVSSVDNVKIFTSCVLNLFQALQKKVSEIDRYTKELDKEKSRLEREKMSFDRIQTAERNRLQLARQRKSILVNHNTVKHVKTVTWRDPEATIMVFEPYSSVPHWPHIKEVQLRMWKSRLDEANMFWNAETMYYHEKVEELREEKRKVTTSRFRRFKDSQNSDRKQAGKNKRAVLRRVRTESTTPEQGSRNKGRRNSSWEGNSSQDRRGIKEFLGFRKNK
ncbi:hypothetical protein EX30DRAFT_365137 [Ascodesmis nigricans]|uniref:Uncharacterized protein n=1 Tax=Ascodesmis nigricans TaxID=341454 RepID=A0A4V3SID1_9PEZI|nr:hypothetical protein EX30DRAFT_365137 [Ascodesmis nigricans]